MQFQARPVTSGVAAFACLALLALTGCERTAQQSASSGPDSELEWARAALERNPDIEVVAVDSEAGVFTIRNKASDAVSTVKVSDIAAAPVAQSGGESEPARTGASTEAKSAQADAVEAEQNAASPPPNAQADAPTEPEVAQAQAQAQPSAPADATGYTIERTDGKLRVSGPGVSIVSAGTPAPESPNESSQTRDEPIICEGSRMLRFDNRDIRVEGDAIIVRDGCELFITNSRIVATGTGVTVRNAVVHVSNSHIEGAESSFDADANSRMYVRGSTFRGLSRRDELAMVQDQGGNRWR